MTSLRNVLMVIPLPMHLGHHDDHPKEPDGDVEAVRADKGEEGREKGASLQLFPSWTRWVEFLQFHADK